MRLIAEHINDRICVLCYIANPIQSIPNLMRFAISPITIEAVIAAQARF